MVDLPPRVAARARWVAVAATTVATAAHGRWGATVAGSTAVAASEATLRRATPATSVAAEATTATHATNVTSSSAATAAATATTSTAATEARALTGDGLEELRNFLVGFLEQLDEVANNSTIATVEESGGDTSVSGTTGTTDAVDVVVNVGRKIVVDDVGNVRNI
jgi:hypothetical protein